MSAGRTELEASLLWLERAGFIRRTQRKRAGQDLYVDVPVTDANFAALVASTAAIYVEEGSTPAEADQMAMQFTESCAHRQAISGLKRGGFLHEDDTYTGSFGKHVGLLEEVNGKFRPVLYMEKLEPGIRGRVYTAWTDAGAIGRHAENKASELMERWRIWSQMRRANPLRYGPRLQIQA